MRESGFDYVELSLRDVVALSTAPRSELSARLEALELPCEACNNFFPAEVRLTGPDADVEQAIAYAATALDCAAQLGAAVVVFGSSGARNVPDGFAMKKARRQLIELLRRLGALAKERGITIVIEPLNKGESNIINSVPEGLRLARAVDHPNVQLLVDFYHLTAERERPGVLRAAGTTIQHVHFARPEGRTFPAEWTEGYDEFFRGLAAIGYERRCSIEAYSADFVSDARRCLGSLRERL